MEKQLFSLHVSRDGQGMLHFRTELHRSSHEFDFSAEHLGALCDAAAAVARPERQSKDEQEEGT